MVFPVTSRRSSDIVLKKRKGIRTDALFHFSIVSHHLEPLWLYLTSRQTKLKYRAVTVNFSLRREIDINQGRRKKEKEEREKDSFISFNPGHCSLKKQTTGYIFRISSGQENLFFIPYFKT